MKTELWDIVARGYGKESIKQLLEDSYVKDKESVEAIADALNTGRATVLRLLKACEIEVRCRESLVISRDEAMNLTVEQIARKHMVPRSTAWRARQKARGYRRP